MKIAKMILNSAVIAAIVSGLFALAYQLTSPKNTPPIQKIEFGFSPVILPFNPSYVQPEPPFKPNHPEQEYNNKEIYQIVGFSEVDNKIIASFLKLHKISSALIGLHDGSYPGSKNVFMEINYSNGSTYRDNFGLGTKDIVPLILSLIANNEPTVKTTTSGKPQLNDGTDGRPIGFSDPNKNRIISNN